MSTEPTPISNDQIECLQCGIEFSRKDAFAKQFCSLECQLKHACFVLEQEKRELNDQITLLNSLRTGHWPDTSKTVETNEQTAIFCFKQHVSEMSDDAIMIYSKMIRAIDIQCQIVITKQGIKKKGDEKAKEGFKKALDKRDETTLPLNSVARAREIFVREHIKQGFSEREAMKLWKVEAVKEKAILAFMKMPGITREVATDMAMATLKCNCGHLYNKHKPGAKECTQCKCEAFSNNVLEEKEK